MEVFVRFWNVTKLKVNVEFIGSTFFGHGTHQNLLKHFHEVTKEVNHMKLYQISINGPSVNLKRRREDYETVTGSNKYPLFFWATR